MTDQLYNSSKQEIYCMPEDVAGIEDKSNTRDEMLRQLDNSEWPIDEPRATKPPGFGGARMALGTTT